MFRSENRCQLFFASHSSIAAFVKCPNGDRTLLGSRYLKWSST